MEQKNFANGIFRFYNGTGVAVQRDYIVWLENGNAICQAQHRRPL
jgi:hypothetical protein